MSLTFFCFFLRSRVGLVLLPSRRGGASVGLVGVGTVALVILAVAVGVVRHGGVLVLVLVQLNIVVAFAALDVGQLVVVGIVRGCGVVYYVAFEHILYDRVGVDTAGEHNRCLWVGGHRGLGSGYETI